MLKPGALSDTVKIYRILPGGTTWMLLATVHMSSLNSSGGAVWSHAYKPQKRGTYKIRVKFLGTSARKASTSPTVKLRVE